MKKEKNKIQSCAKQTKSYGKYKDKDITIGSDCELCFAVDKPLIKNYVNANEFLTTSLRTQLGCDGNSRIAELRPNYAYTPIEHLDNIKKIMKRLINQMDNIEGLNAYSGSGIRDAIGGHIHFGIKDVCRKNRLIVDLLDLMSIFLVSLEMKTNSKRRKIRGGYGRLNAYESKSYGFEYRTLASWLYSENNARSILCLSYVLAYEFMNNRKLTLKMIRTFDNKFNGLDKTKGKGFFDRWAYPRYIYMNFNNSNEKAFILKDFNFYNYFMKNIRKMIKYKDYKPYIENLFSLHHLRKKFRENKGIRDNWSLKRTMTYRLYRFSNDAFLNDIKKSVKNKYLKSKNERSIFIYGLKKGRKYHIETNNSHLYKLISKFAEITDSSLKIESGGRYSRTNSIGFRWDLREEKENLIVQLLKYVSENLDRKLLKEEQETYEQAQAQTDTPSEDDERYNRECNNDEDDDNYCSICGENYDNCSCGE